jgi:hypothetical protein
MKGKGGDFPKPRANLTFETNVLFFFIFFRRTFFGNVLKRPAVPEDFLWNFRTRCGVAAK